MVNAHDESLAARLESWRAEHRRRLVQSALLAAGLAVLGLILLLTAWLKPADAAPLQLGIADGWRFLTAALGFALLAVAAVPLADALEHRERREGLMVLADRWRQMQRRRANSEPRLVMLLRRFYGAGG